jgi:predicted dehydrogenase
MQQPCKSATSVVASSIVELPPVIQGFTDAGTERFAQEVWTPVSDRKIRVGLVGYGFCQFAAQFSFQHHPNVEVVAISDLIPERCARLAQVTNCSKTYPSLEELVKDSSIEAVFVATDAPSHARHSMEVLNHGKHVACAVPAVWGSLEEAEKLFETVKKTGLTYMMFETSTFHDDVHAMRQIYNAGGFGKLIYAEGEYFHYFPTPLDSFNGWRTGLPPQLYPTHSNAYYICVTGGAFTEVSCMGNRSVMPHFLPENNAYQNPFGSEIALFRTNEDGMARMAVCWDTPGIDGEVGRVSGEKGAWWNRPFQGIASSNELVKTLNLQKPPLPPTVDAGGHGGSHGNLCHEFVMAILENRKPLVDIARALNLTVSGIVAHQSALKDGELLKIPQYQF